MGHEIVKAHRLASAGHGWHGMDDLFAEITPDHVKDFFHELRYFKVPLFRPQVFSDGFGGPMVQAAFDLLLCEYEGVVTEMATCSPSYEVHSPQAIAETMVEEAIDGGLTVRGLAILSGGKNIFLLAQPKEGFSFKVGDREHKAFVAGLSAGDKSHSTQWIKTFVDIVCKNTYNAALASNVAKWSQKHTSAYRSLDAKSFIDSLLTDTREAETAWSTLHDCEVTSDERLVWQVQAVNPDLIDKVGRLERIWTDETPTEEAPLLTIAAILGADKVRATFNEVLNDRKRNALGKLIAATADQPGGDDGTLAGVVSGYTHYIDHVAGRDSDARQVGAIAGQGAQLKLDALHLALQFSEKFHAVAA